MDLYLDSSAATEEKKESSKDDEDFIGTVADSTPENQKPSSQFRTNIHSLCT